jgi:hypothetical protein
LDLCVFVFFEFLVFSVSDFLDFEVIYGVLKFWKMFLELVFDFRGVYLVKFIQLRAPYIVFEFGLFWGSFCSFRSF